MVLAVDRFELPNKGVHNKPFKQAGTHVYVPAHNEKNGAGATRRKAPKYNLSNGTTTNASDWGLF